MRVSKYIKPNVNILLEYIYDDSNLISEPYDILVNIKDNSKGFLSTNTSTTVNTIANQLFQIDPVTRSYGKVDTTNYSFLQINNYASGFPLRYDTVIIRLPINYTFGEYIGIYLRAYSFDSLTKNTHDLSNFYFDITDVNTKDVIQYTNPPLLYQEKLWGKEIKILIPSLYEVSNQRTANNTTPNSVNYNLTGGLGMSQLSPIFLEFSFITNKQIINSVTTYNLASKIQLSLPQIPEFQKLGVMIQHSTNGDYFEIYGIYNNTIAEFKSFMDNSVYLGNRYYVNYVITIFEQNIRGKSFTITVTENFNDPIEFRPIIKWATTTAVIDVDMYLIDAVDNSQILRSASYGMLQDEVSKFSLILTKINLLSSTKPKIYNYKSSLTSNSQSLLSNASSVNNIEVVKVPYAVLINQYNIVAKSDNVIVGSSTFYGEGKLVILLKPFDNPIKISIASQVTTVNNVQTPVYLDLTGLGQIQLVFKNSTSTITFDIFQNTGEVDLTNGTVVFMIPTNKISDIRRIYTSGINVFYITSTQQNITTVIYSGLFKLYDSMDNVNNMNSVANQMNSNINANTQATIIPDANAITKGVAIVTRVLTQNTANAANAVVNTASTVNSNIVNSNVSQIRAETINRSVQTQSSSSIRLG
jgi:hypothetical protein